MALNFFEARVFLDTYTGPCEVRVLRLNIFWEEDRITQKIPMNYAPEMTYGLKYFRYSV